MTSYHYPTLYGRFGDVLVIALGFLLVVIELGLSTKRHLLPLSMGKKG